MTLWLELVGQRIQQSNIAGSLVPPSDLAQTAQTGDADGLKSPAPEFQPSVDGKDGRFPLRRSHVRIDKD